MTAESVARIVEALNRSGCRSLVAGGLAVVAHGYLRYTDEMDIALDSESAANRSALDALLAVRDGRQARLPFIETLRRLEEAHRIAGYMKHQREVRRAPDAP
jgi:hypothetical protein